MLVEKLMTAVFAAAFGVCAVLVVFFGVDTWVGVLALEASGLFAVYAGMAGHAWWQGNRDERRYRDRARRHQEVLDRMIDRLA